MLEEEFVRRPTIAATQAFAATLEQRRDPTITAALADYRTPLTADRPAILTLSQKRNKPVVVS